MQVEVLGGVERRRRWSRDDKMRIIEETLAPGAVVTEIARRHGIATSLVFTWRRGGGGGGGAGAALRPGARRAPFLAWGGGRGWGEKARHFIKPPSGDAGPE